jgi:DNA-binding SARP family transcriptional activator
MLRNFGEADLSDLRISLLGAPVAEVDGDPLAVDTRKATALLAYLAVEGRGSRRDSLAGLLWPDYGPDQARGALRRTLSSLKRGLGGRWLVTDRNAIQLASDEVWLDVAEFTLLAQVVGTHGHSPGAACDDCRAALERAAELYRGDFMEGFSLRDSPEFDDWQMRRTDEFQRTLSEVLERLVENLADGGELVRAAERARRWLSIDPLHEPAHRWLMHLYALQGRRSDALRQYRQCVSILDAELGVGPLPETTELYNAILSDSAGVSVYEPPAEPVREAVPGIPLVGREPERIALREAIERAANTGQLVILEGEAGVGKSRLAEDLLQTAARGGSQVVVARCYEDETELPYSPIAEALRALAANAALNDRVGSLNLSESARLVPQLAASASEPPRLEGPGAQQRFLDGVADTIFGGLGGSPPGVLFMDDVHWADEASIDLLAYAIRRLARHSIVVMLAWRPELMSADHRLRRAAAQVRAAGNATILSPKRLGLNEVSDLVRTALPNLDSAEETAERLYEETEGLPFFVVEYLAELTSGRDELLDWKLPVGAANLLAARVSSAGELSRQVLTTAAVIGRSFDFDTLRDASGRGEDETVVAVDELIRGGLVREIVGSHETRLEYDFSHDRLRAFVYEQTGLARRRLLHRRVAESLVRRSGAQKDASLPALIARHYRLGGAETEAAHYFKTAGDRAAAVYANLEALTHYETALALGHPDVSALREAIGDMCTFVGRYRDAINAYESAAAAPSSPEQLSSLEHKLGLVHHRRGELQAADIHYGSALEATDDRRPGVAARIYADRSLSARSNGRTGEALSFAERALDLAERAADKRALGQAHNMLGILNGDEGRSEDAKRHLEMSLKLAEEAEDDQVRVAALNNLALFHGRSGSVEKAIELTKEGLALCTALGDRHREAALHNNLADLLRQTGRLPDAISEVKIAAGIFADVGSPGEMEPEIWKLVEW